MTAKRVVKLERAGLASTVSVDLGSAEDVLATVRAEARRGWEFEGVEYPVDSWIRGVIMQANRRSRQVGLVTVLSDRAQQL